MKRMICRAVLGAVLLGLSARSAHAATNMERFLDRLPADQREKILKQAGDAINNMAKHNAAKNKASNTQAQKMSLDLIKNLYKKAEEAYKNNDMAAAYNYYMTIVNTNIKGVGKMQDKARERLTAIEAEALARYNQADIEYRKGEHVRSAELLDEVLTDYPYCSVADRSRTYMRKIMAEPRAAADIGFAKGMRYEKAEDYYNAVQLYRDVAEKYGPRDDSSPSQWHTGGIRAKIRLEQLLEDPYVKEAIARAEQFQARAKAPSMLANARNYITNKRYDLARAELEALIDQFPDTEEAKQAEVLLKSIQGSR
ncbi:MAG: hypothetical protein JW909_08150 [Planctomycetes bacterium]|nr:hypothetical protein [Planctomycetota bacterium]